MIGLIDNLVSSLRPRDIVVLQRICQLDGSVALRIGHLESVLRVARGVFELLADYGLLDKSAGRIPTRQFDAFFVHHARIGSHTDFIKYVKWWSSTLLARHLRQECEEMAGADLFGGFIGDYRFALRLAVHFEGNSGRGLRNFRLLAGLQQVKRAFLPVDDDFVLDSLQKHKKAMEKPPGPMNTGNLTNAAVVDNFQGMGVRVVDTWQVPSSPETFVREVKERMRMVLANFKPDQPRMLQPSGSACFESSRTNGGASQYLADRYFHEKKFASKASDLWYDSLEFDEDRHGTIVERCYAAVSDNRGELIGMDYLPNHGVHEIRGFPFPRYQELIEECRLRLRAYEHPEKIDGRAHSHREEVLSQFNLSADVMSKSPNEFGPDNLNCRVAAVLEPGKVRTVTAGEALPYWISRSYQKSVHSYIRQIPQFSLCGQPLEKWHLKFLDRLSGEFGWYQGKTATGEDTVWVSGDYSGATDEIDIRLTRACHELMMEKVREHSNLGDLTDAYVDTLTACIEPHNVNYPKNFVDNGQAEVTGLGPCRQKNGQLMGSTLSFPILCIVNFCTAWLALFPHILDFRKVPILVNGDDILFRCPKSYYPIWCDHIKNAGFRKSVGKNFAHVNKIFINSQPWVARKRSDFDSTHLCEFEYTPFFNVGLMHGQSKVAKKPSIEGESGGTYQQLYSLQPEAVRGALNEERAIRRFHSIHREHLRHATANGFFSYHAPREFYGLGMVPSEKAQYSVTQRRVASALIKSGLERSLRGKLYIGDGHVHKPVHDMSRLQGRRSLYRGCIVPPERLRPGFSSGYTVLQKLERNELGLTQDVVTDGENSVMCTSWNLAKKLTRILKRADDVAPYPERLMARGFCQRPYREEEIFCGIEIA
jgi:hypothetical protein